MNNPIDVFDVLVVYSHKIATSACSTKKGSNLPFSKTSKNSHYNNAYAYFLKTCAESNINAAFTTSKDIIGSGLCNSYWLYENNSWRKVLNKCSSSVIFDKFSPKNKQLKANRHMLFSDDNIVGFNDPYMFNLFFDKLKSFNKFTRSSIPTVDIVDNEIDSIRYSISKLKEMVAGHDQSEDFGESVILKDRYGSGGYGIYKIDTDIENSIERIMNRKMDKSFILQPFTLFDHGYEYKDMKGSMDIRLIFMGKEIIQTYVRMAEENDFRCNEHQGGSLTYIRKKDLSSNIIKVATRIVNKLNKPNSLYALDFIVSNSGNVYFLEGNSQPGLDWNLALKKNERMSKALIDKIVDELKIRVNDSFHVV